MSTYDTILIGSSPNALVTAAYLAKAGKRVLVLEPSKHIGGAVVTTAFADEFKADLSLTAGQLDLSIIKDLELNKHGLEVIERKTVTSLLSNGRSFTLPIEVEAAVDVIHSFAPKDSGRYKQFLELLNLASDLLCAAYAMTPPQAHNPSATEALQLAALTGQLRGYGRREMTEVMRLLVMSVRDLLDEWFENTELKGLLASAAIRGLTQGPFAGGTTFNLLHHLAIGDGYFRATAKGGVGAISQALALAAQSYGAQLRTSNEVLQVVVTDNVATGVELKNGEVINASQVISDYDAHYTFTKLVSPPELEPEFNRALKNIRYNGSVARVNLALSELPSFINLDQKALSGTLVIAPSIAHLEKAFDSAKYGKVSDQPYIEVSIPSLADSTLALDGKHIMSIWLQYVPYKGNVEAEQIREIALTQLSEFAPNLRSLVLHSQVLTPHDFQERFHLSEGHLYGGDMTLAQAFFLRPIPELAQYHSPIEHLYLCGAATHPGGGLSGLAGHNLANKLLIGRKADK